jgi:hypothetical protein
MENEKWVMNNKFSVYYSLPIFHYQFIYLLITKTSSPIGVLTKISFALKSE